MLRSVKKAVEYILAEDPNSAIKVHTIRTWCKEGKIKFLTVGNKILIDMDNLLEYIGQKVKKE
ncbi:MAG: helix-turn-helix domain-containing protein [Clostridiales bacterium]|nr:helix-turn-helix domain-containing protein [Clostridiales bacterium]